jgi:hypothetical protein
MAIYNGRESQANRILFMLREALKENFGVGVEITEFMRARIANYNGRIMELRRRGYWIVNYRWTDGGRRHSLYLLMRYWPIFDPEQDAR